MLKEALKIETDDVVLSITSGGDNSLALLLSRPKKIFFVDWKPEQNYITELKLTAPQGLNYQQYLELLGVKDSTYRVKYFNKINRLLSENARLWFIENMKIIENGLIHGGKFEKYLNRFRKYLLPLVHSSETVSKFVRQRNLLDQITFYEKVWNSWRWKLFFSVATNPLLLRKHARQKGAKNSQKTKHNNYFERLEKLIYRNHLGTNHYLCYALIGRYGNSLPNYLLEENYLALKNGSLTPHEFRSVDLLTFLKCTPDNFLTKLNLSDTFEFLNQEMTIEVWKEVVRATKNGGVVVFWCNQMEHVLPQDVVRNVFANEDLENRLYKQDRLYFYRSFHIYTIKK